MNPDPITPKDVLTWTVVILGILVGLTLLIFGLVTFGNWFGRTQARADANNKVAITHILIRNAQQQAMITKAQEANTVAQAQIRYLESVGVRRAQDEIAKTLTPMYIQYEAIKAEQAIATSGKNNTVVYIPSGQGGVPIISNAGTGK